MSAEDAMIAKDEFPEVSYLISCYFFQNWDEVFGHDEADVLKDLLTTEESARLVALRDDLNRILARGFTRDELREYVDSLGVGYMAEDVGGFFAEVRDTLDRHLASAS